jgi:hypothetical protein
MRRKNYYSKEAVDFNILMRAFKESLFEKEWPKRAILIDKLCEKYTKNKKSL